MQHLLAVYSLEFEIPASFLDVDSILPYPPQGIQLDRNYPGKAIELLQAAAPYELGYDATLQLGTMYPVFVRGQAYLELHQGKEAAAELVYQDFLTLWKDADPDIPISSKPRPSTRSHSSFLVKLCAQTLSVPGKSG
jgi:hypothetical protein